MGLGDHLHLIWMHKSNSLMPVAMNNANYTGTIRNAVIMLPLMSMKQMVEIMDLKLLLSKKSLMVLQPCTTSMTSQTRLAELCLGLTLKLNQPFSAQAEVVPQLSPMTVTNLMVKDILWSVALEVLAILNFLPKEKLPLPFLSLIANRY